jgi:hypothetical protein
MNWLTRVLLLSVMWVLAVVVVPVGAHEGKSVADGAYVLTFGWRNEPAYAGVFNGPEVSIALHDAEAGTPFPADIPVEIVAEVTFGSESMTLQMEPMWNTTGHYIADLIPMLPGDYSFRLIGTIGTAAIDEVFTSADGEFSTVEPATDIMFPQAAATDIATLMMRIAELEARLAVLEG